MPSDPPRRTGPLSRPALLPPSDSAPIASGLSFGKDQVLTVAESITSTSTSTSTAALSTIGPVRARAQPHRAVLVLVIEPRNPTFIGLQRKPRCRLLSRWCRSALRCARSPDHAPERTEGLQISLCCARSPDHAPDVLPPSSRRGPQGRHSIVMHEKCRPFRACCIFCWQ